jgi:hypothetical protein
MKWFVPDTALMGNTLVFETWAVALLASPPTSVDGIFTLGLNSIGDGGGAFYSKSGALVADGNSFTTANGLFFNYQIAPVTRKTPHANFNSLVNMFGSPAETPNGYSLPIGIEKAWETLNRPLMSGVTIYVAPWGNDANDGLAWYKAVKTPNQALRNIKCGDIYFAPGSYDYPTDARNTDTGFINVGSGGLYPKKLIAENGSVVFKFPGDDISAGAYVADATYTRCYGMNIVTTNNISNVIQKSKLDKYGNAIPLRKYSSLVTLNANGNGWYFDSVARKFYLNMGTGNPATYLSDLEAVYTNPGTGSRTLIYGVELYSEGITYWGYPYLLNNGAAVPSYYGLNNKYLYSDNYGLLGGAFNYCVTENCLFSYSAGDGSNYNRSGSIIGSVLEYNNNYYYSGNTIAYGADLATNPIGNAFNIQSSSNHSAYIMRVNGKYEFNAGQCIADTVTSYSWVLGPYAGQVLAPDASGLSYAIQFQNNNAWIEGAYGYKGLSNALVYNDGGGTTYYNNIAGPVVSSGSNVYPYNPVI